MTQDLYYYETGYTDDNYFVYTADAESLEAGTFAMTAACGVIRAASVSLTSEFTIPTAVLSNLKGADLFAFTDAALAIEVSVIRDNNIAVTSAFVQTTAGARVRYVSSDQFIDTAISVANTRVKFNEAAVDAAFSLTAQLSKQVSTIEGYGTWSSDFVVDAKGTRKQNLIDCDVSAEFTQTTDGNRIRGLESSLLEATIFEVAEISVTKQALADLTATATITAVISHVEGADLTALSNASLTAEIARTRPTSASLQVNSSTDINGNAIIRPSYDADPLQLISTSSVSTVGNRSAGLVSALSATASQSTDINLTSVAQAQLSANATLAGQVNEVVQLSADLTATATLAAVISHVEGADLTALSNATLSADVEVVKTFDVVMSSQTTQTVAANVAAESVVTLSTSATVSANADKIKTNAINLSSSFALSATAYLRWKRPLQIYTRSAATQLRSDTVKFGSGALYAGGTGNSLRYYGNNDLKGINLGNGEDFLVEFWVNFGTLPGAKTLVDFTSTSGTVLWSIGFNASNQVRYVYEGDGGQRSLTSSGVSFSTNTWYHIAVARSFQHSIWVNGTRVGNSSNTLTSVANSSNQGYLSIGGMDAYVDDLRVVTADQGSNSDTLTALGRRPTLTSITVPTAAFINDNSYTRYLGHFNMGENYVDDTVQIAQGVITASSAFTSSVTAQKFGPVYGSGTWTSAATQTAVARADKVLTAAISANGFVASIIGRIRPEFADLTATSTATINAGKKVVGASSLTASASLSATGIKIHQSAVTLDATATVSAQANRTRRTAVALSSTTSLSATAVKTTATTAALSAVFTVRAEPDDVYLQLIYGAANTSGYITSTGATVSTTFTDSSNAPTQYAYGYWPVHANFWFSINQGLTDGQSIVLYTSGDNNTVILNNISGAYYVDVQLTGLQYDYNPSYTDSYERYTRTSRLRIPLGSNNPVNEFVNIDTRLVPYIYQIHPVDPALLTPPPVVQWGNPKVNGADVTETITTTNTLIASGTPGYVSPSHTGSWAVGGQWGDATNNQDVYIDQVWIKNSGSDTIPPISDFIVDGNASYITPTGYTTSGLQAQVWLPWGNLLDRSTLSPAWNYTAHNRVIPGLVKEGNASVTSQATVNAIGVRSRLASAAFTSSASTSATILRIKSSAVTISAEFTQATVGQRNAVLTSTQSVTATLSSPINRLRQGVASLSTNASMSVNAIKVTVTQAEFTANATVVSTANRLRGITDELSLTATIDANAIKTAQSSADLQVSAFEFDAAVKTGQGFVDCTTTATVEANARITSGSRANLEATSTVEATPWNVVVGSADLSAEASQNTIPTYLRRNESIMQSTAQMTVNAAKIARTDINAQSNATATVTTNNSRLRGITSNQTAQFTQTTANKVLRLASASLQTTATILFIPGVLVRVEADLLCEGFVLSAGRVIHLDPFLQLKIAQETRDLLVIEETRLITVEEETRVNKIKGYPQ